MRFRLLGFTGERPPVPVAPTVDPEDPPDGPPVDPGEFTPPDPLVLVLNDGDVFHKADYLALGYNRFEVMCVGAAGGDAGSIFQYLHKTIEKVKSPGTPSGVLLPYLVRRFGIGGAGGGGGIHRIKGRLALLPANVPVVVGAPGVDGGYSAYDEGSGTFPARTVPSGTDGGASSFGGVICRASGGKGGLGQSMPAGTGIGGSTGGTGTGGDGGIGNTDGSGGGADGSPLDGSWNGAIGAGGKGGHGSYLCLTADGVSDVRTAAGNAGRGSYSAEDPLTSGGAADLARLEYFSSDFIQTDPANTAWWRIITTLISGNYIPGRGGGASTYNLDGDEEIYGTKVGLRAGDGKVVVRLTYVIV